MDARMKRLSRPLATSCLGGLLFCLSLNDPNAQIAAEDSATTSFGGQAVAFFGFTLGSSLTFVNSNALFVSGGAQAAAPEADFACRKWG